MLPAKAGDEARLQERAVLEKQSGADWKDVALSLQYGNRVTFPQEIYRSYYVERPEVPVEVLSRILPGVDARARQLGAAMDRALPGGLAGPPAPPPMAVMEMPASTAPAEPARPVASVQGVEETVFPIAGPVDLPAGQSASVPISDDDVPAELIAGGGTRGGGRSTSGVGRGRSEVPDPRTVIVLFRTGPDRKGGSDGACNNVPVRCTNRTES